MTRGNVGIVQGKMRERANSLFAKGRCGRLDRCDFSIISNNCWAGSDARESSHYDALQMCGETDKPIGLIDDVEIVFLHCPTAKEAAEKWYGRIDRVNWGNLFIKFSQMNSCTDEDLCKFDEIDFSNKVCFTAMPRPDLKSSVFHPSSVEGGQIFNDSDRFSQGLDLYG